MGGFFRRCRPPRIRVQCEFRLGCTIQHTRSHLAPSPSGRVLLSSQHVAKMMGELFALKNQAGAVGHSNEGRNPVANQVNLEFDTLDTPDVFWEFEEAAS